MSFFSPAHHNAAHVTPPPKRSHSTTSPSELGPIYAFIESDRNRGGRCIAVHGNIRIHHCVVDVQLNLQLHPDSLIGLMWNEQLDVVGC